MRGLIIENKTPYSEDDLFGIARRQNNNKRIWLIVNRLQAKHVPAAPSATLRYFKQLGHLIKNSCRRGERVLVIGFCETATALGAAVAGEIEESAYCHTTREPIDSIESKAQFCEEHSHAVNHDFYLSTDYDMSEFDRIVFVDDELSTGKTILNFINSLKNTGVLKPDVKFTVGALISSGAAEIVLLSEKTEFYYLTKIDSSKIAAPTGSEEAQISAEFPSDGYGEIAFGSPVNPRVGVAASRYHLECERFSEHVSKKLNIGGADVLVLGTEEFMYPALQLGAALEKEANKVAVHATTRSPIAAINDGNCPIRSQCVFQSLYDLERTSYIYNLRKYDAVVVATDASRNAEAEKRICGMLEAFGNDNIHIARWV
jgi:pyrimidine operon attenuation protein/uracil phosphoribosyltransferase